MWSRLFAAVFPAVAVRNRNAKFKTVTRWVLECLTLAQQPAERHRETSTQRSTSWFFCQETNVCIDNQTFCLVCLFQNVAPNHRANDVVVLEDKPQVFVARFMYGPLDMVSLSGEKVILRF